MNLSDTQKRIFSTLSASRDVPISIIFRAALRRWPNGSTQKEQQQAIGPYLTRLRRKIEPYNWTIKPGVRRGTYRLTKLNG
jgi:hypothetical protein